MTEDIALSQCIFICVLASCTADNGTCDRPIDPTNQNQHIVWGIGSLGATAFQHHTRAQGMSSRGESDSQGGLTF